MGVLFIPSLLHSQRRLDSPVTHFLVAVDLSCCCRTLDMGRDFETEDGLKLGAWLGSHLVKAKKDTLPEER